MDHNHAFSLHSRIRSIGYAINGLKKLFRTEHNARIHLAAAISAVFMGCILKIHSYEWCLIAFSIGFVFAAELFNTAIECLTDIISPEYSARAEKIKDLAAGGVLIASLTAAAIGTIILIHHI
jgi:diacylglycerol kinase (ATP)